MARVGSVKNDAEVLVFVNEDVGALICNTGGDLNRRRDDRSNDVMDPMSELLAVLLCQLCLPDSTAVAFRILVCEGFVLPS